MPEEKNSQSEMMLWDTLGILVSSGVPILKSLDTLKKVFPAYSAEVGSIYDALKEGETVTGALNKYSSSFHPLAESLIDAGEQTGAFPEMCLRLRDLIKQDISYGVNPREQMESPDMLKLLFFRYAATLIDAGLPVTRTLKVAQNVPALGIMREAAKKSLEDLTNGSTFSESMAAQPNYFNEFEVALTHAGELGGVLDVTTGRLADYAERKYYSSKKKI